MDTNKIRTITCSCGQTFKNEHFASALAQFNAHTAILAPYGKLQSNDHTIKLINGKPKEAQ